MRNYRVESSRTKCAMYSVQCTVGRHSGSQWGNDVTLNLNRKRNNKRHHCVGVEWVDVGARGVKSFQLISSPSASSSTSAVATQSVFTSLPASPWAHRRPSCRPWSPAWDWSPSLWTSCPRALSLCCSCSCGCGWVEFVFVVVAVVLFLLRFSFLLFN